MDRKTNPKAKVTETSQLPGSLVDTTCVNEVNHMDAFIHAIANNKKPPSAPEELPINASATKIISRARADRRNNWADFLVIQRMERDAILPTRGSPGSAGLDLYSYETKPLPPWESQSFKTKIKMRIPKGLYGRIASRSGLAFKRDIEIGAGVIDNDYQGEIVVKLRNFSKTPYIIQQGERIAQIIFEKYSVPEVKTDYDIEQLFGKTKRGTKGFGSTGK